MHTWIRRPQEKEGTYRFSGTMFITQEVSARLSPGEIVLIYREIQELVNANGGIDYFQVFENEVGDKLYFIDECSPEMMLHSSFKEEDNHCTLLFSHEY